MVFDVGRLADRHMVTLSASGQLITDASFNLLQPSLPPPTQKG